MWYLVARMLAWVLRDVLLESFPERYITPAVVGVTLLEMCIRDSHFPVCFAHIRPILPRQTVGRKGKIGFSGDFFAKV